VKIVSVVGARPELIQASPVSRALRAEHREVLVHTGQHYDYAMSQAFFDDLGLPAPDYNLGVGSGSQAAQTAEALARLEPVLLAERPDLIVLRGDTNSTLAGALAAAKLQIPSAHVEAGERSFDRRMPEEVNRLVVDGLADLHLCITAKAVRQLEAEGLGGAAYWVGDVMLDAVQAHRALAGQRSDLLTRLGLTPGRFALATVHRPANTDDPARLANLLAAFSAAAEPVVWPLHPRTSRALAGLEARPGPNLKLIEPVGYFDMLVLEEQARLIATDSGGVAREAYFLGTPCLTLRDETEWSDVVATGWNRLVGADPERILANWHAFQPPVARPALFGDGTAAQRIARLLAERPPVYGRRRSGPAPSGAPLTLAGGSAT
jgi:UDP-N-acetylglucosamine 2-epimerase